jgi:hypothetical protein
MSNPTFNIANPIYIVNKSSDVDSRYGPWSSVADANSNVNINIRDIGLTVGVSAVGVGVTEYWYKNGVQNTDLVLKTTGGGGSVDLSIFYNISSDWTSTTNTVCSLSSNWNNVYSLVNTNSSIWSTSNVVTSFPLSSNNARIIDVSKGNIFFKAVNVAEYYSYSNFTTGKTIVFYLSAGEPLYGNWDDLLHQFPINTYFNNVGESNYVLTIKGKVTKITLSNINNSYYGSTELFDLNQPTQYLSDRQNDILLDGILGYLLLEDGNRLYQDDAPVMPLP